MFLVGMIALLPAPAIAADERRLTAAEVEQILDAAATKREARASEAAAKAPAPLRPIEGEVGIAVGTGGYREAFGTAVIPVGAEGVAIVSFDTAQSRNHMRRKP